MESPNATCDKKEGIPIWHHGSQERIWTTVLGTHPCIGVALLQHLQVQKRKPHFKMGWNVNNVLIWRDSDEVLCVWQVESVFIAVKETHKTLWIH